MEELAATQEELSRKETESQKVIEALKGEVERLTPKTSEKVRVTG